VYGLLKHETGSIEAPLICDWPNRPKQKVDHEHGKKSLTHYRVISYGDNSTLIELTPVTGRSHQLRVHMLSIGHPILGDRLYAHDEALTVSPRLQLHAKVLTVSHPVTKECLTFQAPCPFQ